MRAPTPKVFGENDGEKKNVARVMEERQVFEHQNFISSRCARVGRLKNGTKIALIGFHLRTRQTKLLIVSPSKNTINTLYENKLFYS